MSAKPEKNAGPISDPTILDTVEEYNNAAESKANEEYAARFKSPVAHSSFMDKIVDKLQSRREDREKRGLDDNNRSVVPAAPAPKKRVFKVLREDYVNILRAQEQARAERMGAAPYDFERGARSTAAADFYLRQRLAREDRERSGEPS
jgi:hypothetical protein